MPITTYTNAPYNDDFASAESKNYLRILFQPGRSVQVRELNQLQSSLQDQIAKFGDHVFKDGDRVLNGYTTYDENIQSIPVTFTNSVQPTATQLKNLSGIEVYKSGTTTLRAKIMGVESFVGNNNSTFYRLYLKYFGTDVAGGIDKFAGSDVLMLGDATTISLGTNTTIIENAAIATVATLGESLEDPGYYGGFFQDEGVFFVKGTFVHTDAQAQFYIKETATTKLTGDCVFNIKEDIVTYDTDTSLLDNAAGTPNQNAPGADRYRILLELAFVPSGSTGVTADQQRIELLEIQEDNVTLPARTEYSELGKALATRSDETNGSFTVKPFKLDVREYFNNEAGNRGKYTADEIIDNNLIQGVSTQGDAETEGKKRYVIGVEPSTAYIQGYRVELEDRQDLVALKGQSNSDIKIVENFQQSLNFGGYILAAADSTALAGGFFSGAQDFLTVPNQTFELQEAQDGTLVGTCRVSAITRNLDVPRPLANNNSTENATYRIYIYDINITAANKTLKDAKHIELSISDSNGFTNSDGFTLEGVSDKIFELPYDAVESTGDITYKVSTQYKIPATRSSANQETISATVGKFTSVNPLDYAIVAETDDKDAAITNGYHVPNLVELGVNGTTATIHFTEADGTTASVDDDIIIYAYEEVTAAPGIKSVEDVTETHVTNLGSGSVITLDETDAYQITSVKHSEIGSGATEIKDQFIFNGGQTLSHYGFASLKYIGSTPVSSGTLTVEYKHFSIVTEGPFTTESYTTSQSSPTVINDISAADIPLFEGLRLSNCIDFRRSITASTLGKDPYPGTSAKFDINYYAPRIDLVSLNQLGDAVITSGVASTNPKRPQLPKDSIELFEIYKPGYLYSLDDLQINENKQRGYKMKDISELEDRIKNVEYYTALTMLEKETTEKQLFDGSGERFKNGIFTDAFTGHGGGETENPAYKIGIDREEGIARPMYLSENSRWSYKDSGSTLLSGATSTTSSWNNQAVPSNTKIHSGKRKGVVCLDFIEKSQIIQPFATEHMSVNPYDVATWSGTLEISPTSDEWKDVTHRPDIVNNVEGNNEALLKQIAENPNILGTEWNEWQTSWTGWRWGRRGSRWPRRRRRWWSRRRWWRRARQTREGIQTSLKTTFNNEVVDDVPVDTSFIPFIRSRKVYFKAQLLKPNTKFYVYFDDVNITSYCAEASFQQFGGEAGSDGGTDVVRYDGQTSISGSTGTITTDGSGEVSGWIVVPNNDSLRFRTGTRQIRLTDQVNNNKLLETSSAETSYFAKGILETRQRTVLSTRQLSLERTRVSQARNVTRRRWRVWRDPVAQTFMIGNEATGVFLSSIDLFIQAADPLIPLELSIVTVENGIPTQDTVPHSKVIKKRDDITVSPDAQTSSNFMFDQPVYLQPGVEYAIVLISNSARWRVWVSRVGGTNVVAAGQNAEKVTKNVNLGVLLKSQNASTWTPDQNADLKFTINRADFQEETDLTAQFLGACPQRGEVTYINVDLANNFGYNAGAPEITITGPGGSSGATAYASIAKGGKIDNIVISNNGIGYDNTTTVTIAAPTKIPVLTSEVDTTNNYIAFNAIEFTDGQEITYDAGGGAAIGNISNIDVLYVKQITNASYPKGGIYQLYTDALLTSQVSFSSTGNDAQGFTPSGQATGTPLIDTWKGSMFYNLIEEMVLPEASTSYELKLRSDDATTNGTDEEAIYEIVPNDILYTGEIFTHDGDSGVGGGTSYDDTLQLTATLGTTDSKISPIIDLDRISLLSLDNIISSSAQKEVQLDAGESLARYISRTVDLENPADGINIYFDGMLPDESCDIKVYVKRRLLNNSNLFEQESWTEISPVGDKRLTINSEYEFQETEYSYQADDEQFDRFSIKIVFTSSNKAFAPEIKNLRAIATV